MLHTVEFRRRRAMTSTMQTVDESNRLTQLLKKQRADFGDGEGRERNTVTSAREGEKELRERERESTTAAARSQNRKGTPKL